MGKDIREKVIISVEVCTVHLKVYNDVIFLRKITSDVHRYPVQ